MYAVYPLFKARVPVADESGCGCLESVEWNGGTDYWNGNTGIDWDKIFALA